ncbi:cullin-1-like protein, partial [Trifolium pratense]
MTQLKLNNEDLVRLLYSLSCRKYRILRKEPDTNTVTPTDNFKVNTQFSDESTK